MFELLIFNSFRKFLLACSDTCPPVKESLVSYVRDQLEAKPGPELA